MGTGADGVTGQAGRPRGGRTTAEMAARLGDTIVDVATEAFLRDGYAATSIESVAKQARVGKRTLYARFPDKAALFGVVLERLMARWLAAPEAQQTPKQIEPALVHLAALILAVALQPEALALHRLLIAEGRRFPDMLVMLRNAGASAGADRIGALLAQEMAAGRLPSVDPAFAAEQFMHLVLSGPRRRALGLGLALSPAELASWGRRSVALFLDGCRRGQIGLSD